MKKKVAKKNVAKKKVSKRKKASMNKKPKFVWLVHDTKLFPETDKERGPAVLADKGEYGALRTLLSETEFDSDAEPSAWQATANDKLMKITSKYRLKLLGSKYNAETGQWDGDYAAFLICSRLPNNSPNPGAPIAATCVPDDADKRLMQIRFLIAMDV